MTRLDLWQVEVALWLRLDLVAQGQPEWLLLRYELPPYLVW